MCNVSHCRCLLAVAAAAVRTQAADVVQVQVRDVVAVPVLAQVLEVVAVLEEVVMITIHQQLTIVMFSLAVVRPETFMSASEHIPFEEKFAFPGQEATPWKPACLLSQHM